jgi:hypothetical protein
MSIPVHRTARASQRSSRAEIGAGNAWDMRLGDSFHSVAKLGRGDRMELQPESSSGSDEYYTETLSV